MTATKTSMNMGGASSGYCYEFEGKRNWRASRSEKWDTVIYTVAGSEVEVGSRLIDGAACKVFRCPDGKFRAVAGQ